MKILYINGLKFNDKESETLKYIKKEFSNHEVVACDWNYNNFDFEAIKECVLEHNPDIIVASSTGCLIADQIIGYPKVFINPVIDVCDLVKMFNRDFSKFPKEVKKTGDEKIVILGKNDEILDYKKSLNFYNNCRVYEEGHRILNKEVIKEAINDMIKFIENSTFVL